MLHFYSIYQNIHQYTWDLLKGQLNKELLFTNYNKKNWIIEQLMICLRCPHTLRSSWEKTILDPLPPFWLLHFREGMVWNHTASLDFPAHKFSFLFLLNKLKFAFNIKIIQPMERFLKLCYKKSFCFCSSRHQIMILTNIFTELATGLTCFQIDFFFYPLVSCRNNFNLKVIS